MDTPSTDDIFSSREAREEIVKNKLIYVELSTILLQSRCCSSSGLEMASKRQKGIIFKIGEKISLVLKIIWNNLYL